MHTIGLVFQSYVYPTGYLTFPLDKRSFPRLGDQPPDHVSPLSGWVLPYPAGYGFPRPFGCRRSLLGRPVPAVELARSCDRVTGCLQTTTGLPQRGCHVPHREDTCGELASLRRERGTVSAGPLRPADHRSYKDVSVTFVPFMRYDASTKASRVFNSAPTFPRRDFGCDSLLSLCFYDLLKTPRLLTTPRPYGNRRLVLAWSGLFITSFHV